VNATRTETATKRCTGCGQSKPVDEFAFRNRGKARRQSWCRVCVAAYNRDRNKETRDA
jgi:transposase